MELSLDLSLSFVPRTISELLGEVSHSKDGSQKMNMLEDFLRRLEDEMRKIDAFKRELPLCMILLNDAITRLKEEIDQCTSMQNEPPMKTNSGGNGSLAMGKGSSDKKNWMSSAQLWGTETELRINGEDDRSVPHNPIQARKETNNNSGGAFLAFNENLHVSNTVMRDDKEVSEVPSFGLMTSAFELNNHGNSRSPVEIIKGQQQPQPRLNLRKQRRCWSPELHRRFVDALQRLGGPQVATPKQIRELMQVEGLTNDEVKSHLQKYRLHFRRVPVSNDEQDHQCGDNKKLKGNLSSQSGSPQGPLFLAGSAKGLSSSGRNSMDTEDDEQSDCHSWKGGLHHHHQQPEAGVF